jgi:hypothetical protein
MFNIPSRKERTQAKMFGDTSPLQSVTMGSKSQEVNDLAPDFDYNPSMKVLNVFREGDVIILDKAKSPRYSKIGGLVADLKGSIGRILSEDLVNISYWDTDPPVIKTVPVNHLTLHSSNSILAKVRYKILSIIRKIRVMFKRTQDF